MKEKSKAISGQLIRKRRKMKFRFTDQEKHDIIREFLSSDCTKRDIWEKYTGEREEHGQLLRWMRQLGYEEGFVNKSYNFIPKSTQMHKKKNKQEESFEELQLKKRIEELEKQLKDAEMKSVAFSTMIDIAEKEFKIPIRKKYNTKP